MPSAFRYQNAVKWTIGVAIVTGSVFLVIASRVWLKVQVKTSGEPGKIPALSPLTPPVVTTGQFWATLQARAEKQAANGTPQVIPDRFRLAGTFFVEGAGDATRRAILDDTTRREQFIVSEGERIGDVTVEAIFYDHVTLRSPAGLRELWVEFSSRTQPLSVTSTNRSEEVQGSTNKFGCVKAEDNRWKFSRKPLLDYYQELLDEPDRMVAVFDTMKPVRDERNKITGYVVGIEGEKNFFDAVGLQQGDIVRSVNSLPMTNRRRAEAMIDQFLKDRMNIVVLEVERGGKVTKQIYQMQP